MIGVEVNVGWERKQATYTQFHEIPHPPRNRGFAPIRGGRGYGRRSDLSCLIDFKMISY